MITFQYRMLLLTDGERISRPSNRGWEDEAYRVVRAYQRAHGAQRLVDNHQVVTGVLIPSLGIRAADFVFLTDGRTFVGSSVCQGDGGAWYSVPRLIKKLEQGEPLSRSETILLVAAQATGMIDLPETQEMLLRGQQSPEECFL